MSGPLPTIQKLHTDTAPGWSGSPVINLAGQVIGLVMGVHADDRRLSVITPAEAWRCRSLTGR
jgi:S1-C subfamily serine protease